MDAVTQVIVRQGKVVVGASTGSVALLVDGGKQFDILYDEDDTRGDASRRFAAEPGSCSTTAATTRTPVYVSSFAEWQRQYPRSATLAADGGYASAAVLPLSAEGAVLACCRFTSPRPSISLTNTGRSSNRSRSTARKRRSCASLQPPSARGQTPSPRTGRRTSFSPRCRTSSGRLNAMLGWAAMLRNGSSSRAGPLVR